MIVYEFPVAADGTFKWDKSRNLRNSPVLKMVRGSVMRQTRISSKPSTGLQQRYATKPMDHCSRSEVQLALIQSLISRPCRGRG